MTRASVHGVDRCPTRSAVAGPACGSTRRQQEITTRCDLHTVHVIICSWLLARKSHTAENVVEVTLLPHANVPLLTPQLPFDEVMVKLELVPEMVYVANVCVDQVPAERRPPTVEPDCNATIVAFAGREPAV